MIFKGSSGSTDYDFSRNRGPMTFFIISLREKYFYRFVPSTYYSAGVSRPKTAKFKRQTNAKVKKICCMYGNMQDYLDDQSIGFPKTTEMRG